MGLRDLGEDVVDLPLVGDLLELEFGDVLFQGFYAEGGLEFLGGGVLQPEFVHDLDDELVGEGVGVEEEHLLDVG